ncbi:MAG: hypothetical protein PHS82_09870 [Lachnospiraceae bacterium]|nr:hypothetical protein [Lachnospiraceae bacterium]
MRCERKYRFIMNLLLCAVICLSFCYSSFEDANRQSAWLDTHASIVTQSDTLQSSHILQSAGFQEEEALMPSSMRAAFFAHGQVKEESIRNYCYLIFAILFKIALIPCFIFVIMGLGMRCQTPLLQLILEFIQNKDGKKRNCVTAE